MTSTGEPFHFLPTAPDVLFCKGSPPMKKVIMTVQPDLLQSASKRRQTSASVAPRVLTKKRKMITRRVIKKPAPASPSPSEPNTNQDAAKNIPNVESLEQHEMAATPDALMDANEEQIDTVDILDVNTSSNRTIAPEPPNTSSEQVTLQNQF